MTGKIFVSYSSADLERTLALVDLLKSKSFECWIAKRALHGGDGWADEIPQAIKVAPAMIVVFSRHAAASGHVKRELLLAIDENIKVFPFRIENIEPQDDAFKFAFVNNHWIDAFDDWEAAVDSLAEALAKTLPPRTVSQPPEARSRGRLAILGGTLAAAVGAGIFFLPHQPQWIPLPAASNFVNATQREIIVYSAARADADPIATIGPSQTLYFNGELPSIARATMNKQPWLKLHTSGGEGFVLESGLQALDANGRPVVGATN